jgi:hypothetical protein
MDVTPCGFVDGKKNFGGISLNMEAAIFFPKRRLATHNVVK